MTRSSVLGLTATLTSIAGISLLYTVAGGAAAPACDPDNGGLKLPSGFCALVVADDLGAARHMAVGENGDLYVALMRKGSWSATNRRGVIALRDTSGDGKLRREGADRRERTALPASRCATATCTSGIDDVDRALQAHGRAS